jgi:hypothetical protein
MNPGVRPLVVVWLLAMVACDDPDASQIALEEQRETHGWGPEQCPAPPEGVQVGFHRFDQIADLRLLTCGEEEVALTDVCGADAAWLYFVHTWCPNCQQLGAKSEAIHDTFAGQNLASINIVVADSSDNRPDEADCRAWREELGQDQVITLFDPSGASFALFENPYTSLNVVLDHNRVIMSKFHSSIDRDVLNAIQARLEEAAAP